MSFLGDVVQDLPGSNEVNPLTGQSPYQFVESTTSGNLSNNGYNAIRALDPTITAQNLINGVDKGVGGNGNVFSQNSMNEEAGILNAVGKVIAASYIGNEAGGLNTAEGGAAAGGAAAGMNNGSIAEGAAAGALVGAVAPASTQQTTTDPTQVTQTANGASTVQQSQSALGMAGQGAAQGAVQAGVAAEQNHQDVGNAVLGGALSGAISGGVTNNMSPEIAQAINGAVTNGIAADRSGQPIENGLFYGAVTGAAGGYAGDSAYQATNSTPLARAADSIGQYVAGDVARNNLPANPNQPTAQQIAQEDPQFQAYMRYLQRGYSPQVSDAINPLVLAGVGNGTNVEQTITTQLATQNGGVSPLLIQGNENGR